LRSQNITAQARAHAQSDGRAVFLEKWFGLRELQCFAKTGVIAKARMGVQRQVGAVHSEIVFDQLADEFALGAGPRQLRIPKQAVMDDQQIRARLGSHPHGGEGGIHRGGDAGDLPVVFHLQTVVRAIVIADGVEPQSLVAVGHDGFEVCFFLNGWHPA